MMLSDAELLSYDYYLVAFSGGKDSEACVLHLIERGVQLSKIELWHHDVDGREGSTLMDWPCTRSYCEAFARGWGLPIYFSWKVGGFEGEMNRTNAPTQRTAFEVPADHPGVAHVLRYTGGSGKKNTRRMFPQVSADLSVRWCSAYLKIMVMDSAIRNQKRFNGRRTLVVTGERAEESASRAKYEVFEPHRSDLREGRTPRHVDHYRPVHGWSTAEVWAILERHGVNPHPAYRCGFGRVSCMKCIFGNQDQWASVRALDQAGVDDISDYEERWGKTIHRTLPVFRRAIQGIAYTMHEHDKRAAMDPVFDEPIRLKPWEWKLPSGAYADACGPT